MAVARLLNGGQPDIYSHRHGGMRYELRRQSARVQIGKGMRIDTTDATLRVLSDRSELFDYGDKAIVYVANRKVTSVACDWLLDHMGRVVDYYSVRVNRDKEGNQTSIQEVAQDAPTAVATAIIAKHAHGRIASFELWDDLVRQPLCWLKQFSGPSLRTDLPIFDDPTESITRSESENPDQAKLSAMLEAWHTAFGNTPTTVAMAKSFTDFRSPASVHIADAIDEIAGQGGKVNGRILGRWIERHALSNAIAACVSLRRARPTE